MCYVRDSDIAWGNDIVLQDKEIFCCILRS